MNISFFLILVGLVVGMVWRVKAGDVSKKFWAIMGDMCFKSLLPLVVSIEVLSMNLNEWWLFAYGAAFVFILYFIGFTLTRDKYLASLLATAEGGTLGFMFYNSIRVEPLSRFFLIDMLGNGGALFSFIYWRISGIFKFWEFTVKNRLMLALWTGLALNILASTGIEILHLRGLPYIADISWSIGLVITLLISVIVGTEVKLRLSRKIFFSKFFWTFWGIRLAGMSVSMALRLPFALTILFILPPSFLLPVIYTDQQNKEKEHAANFIAACLPITFLIFVAMKTIY